MGDRPLYIHEHFGGQCQIGDVAPYVLVPGSEQRVRQFADTWDDARMIAHHYEFTAYSGAMDGVPISACSTGCGGRSTAIAIDELVALGGTTFIRPGLSGAIQPDVQLGDLVIASGAVRLDSTSEHYVFVEYPATAHFEVISALVAAAQRLGYPFHVGIVATASTFHLGEGTAGFNGYRHSGMENIAADLRAARVYDWDNETATLLTLSSLYGLRAGRINAVVDDPETGLFDPVGEERVIKTALEAVRILATWDGQRVSEGGRYSLPPFPSA